MIYDLSFRWTVSRARNTAFYNICTLWVDGKRDASCIGGGYDMRGTVLGSWIARRFADRLLKLKEADMPAQHEWKDGQRVEKGHYFYGLTFHDPNYDPGKAIIGKDADDRTLGGGSEGKTVEQAEKEGTSFGLERYQALYAASSKVPTDRHTVPLIDGACGITEVWKIAEAIGLKFERIDTGKKSDDLWRVEVEDDSKVQG